jgi:hypothetical protein
MSCGDQLSMKAREPAIDEAEDGPGRGGEGAVGAGAWPWRLACGIPSSERGIGKAGPRAAHQPLDLGSSTLPHIGPPSSDDLGTVGRLSLVLLFPMTLAIRGPRRSLTAAPGRKDSQDRMDQSGHGRVARLVEIG